MVLGSQGMAAKNLCHSVSSNVNLCLLTCFVISLVSMSVVLCCLSSPLCVCVSVYSMCLVLCQCVWPFVL